MISVLGNHWPLLDTKILSKLQVTSDIKRCSLTFDTGGHQSYSYLKLKGRMYYFSRRVPKRLQEQLSRSSFTSLSNRFKVIWYLYITFTLINQSLISLIFFLTVTQNVA